MYTLEVTRGSDRTTMFIGVRHLELRLGKVPLSPPIFSRSFSDLAATAPWLVANPVANRVGAGSVVTVDSISNGRTIGRTRGRLWIGAGAPRRGRSELIAAWIRATSDSSVPPAHAA